MKKCQKMFFKIQKKNLTAESFGQEEKQQRDKKEF